MWPFQAGNRLESIQTHEGEARSARVAGGDEKEKTLLPESEHGSPIESLGDLLEAPKPKEWVSEKVAGFLKGKIGLGRGS